MTRIKIIIAVATAFLFGGIFAGRVYGAGDDLFRFGETVNETGLINGDVYLLGDSVVYNATASGDLLIAGVETTVNGRVESDVRALGGSLIFTGQVNGNLTAVGGTVVIARNAVIKGNLTILAGSLEVWGDVLGNVRGSAGDGFIDGDVGGNVFLEGEKISLGPKAKLSGDFKYSAAATASVSETASVSGKTVSDIYSDNRRFSLRSGDDFLTVFKMVNIFSSFILGMFLLRFFPGVFLAGAKILETKPLNVFLKGLLWILGGPLILLVLFLTVIGMLIALFGLTIYLAVIYFSKVLIGFAVGRRLLLALNFGERRGMALLTGLLLWGIATNLRPAGMIFSFLSALFGCGAIYLMIKNYYHQFKEKPLT